MFMAVCNAIIIFLAIVGLVEFVRIAALQILKINCDSCVWTLVPIFGHDEKLEMTLRAIAAKVKWSFGMRRHKIICLNLGMDSETSQICNLICREYGFMQMCTVDEMLQIISSKKLTDVEVS